MAIEDLKPIQRYEIEAESSMFGSNLDICKDKDGEWCKWEDVAKVLDEVNKLAREVKGDIAKIKKPVDKLMKHWLID